MRIRDCIVKAWKEIIFTIVMIIYLVELNALNKELNACNFDSPFALLQYKDFAALRFFIAALFLFLIGCLLVWHGIRYLLRKCDSFEEMITMLLVVMVIIGLLISLIVFIDNPILRAVFSVGLVIAGFVGAAE